MTGRHYTCWVLSSTEIEHFARKRGLHLTREQERMVAARFKDALSWALEDWESILAAVIEVEVLL